MCWVNISSFSQEFLGNSFGAPVFLQHRRKSRGYFQVPHSCAFWPGGISRPQTIVLTPKGTFVRNGNGRNLTNRCHPMKNTKPLFPALMFPALILTFGVLFHIHAQDTFTNGLVAYYPFNGNANDESGNGRNGVVQGATLVPDRFGRSSNAYRFDDVAAGIRIGASPVTAELTIAAWIFKEGDSSTHDQIVCVTNVGGVYLNIYPNENPALKNHIDFGANYSPSDRYFSPNPIPLNAWVHVLASYDGQRVRLYQNGQLVQDSATGPVALVVVPCTLAVMETQLRLMFFVDLSMMSVSTTVLFLQMKWLNCMLWSPGLG